MAGETPASRPPQRATAPRRSWMAALSSLGTFDSLKVAGFRWFFVASLGAFGAMNMQMLARGYVVFVLTGSYAALGVVSLAQALPGMALTLVGGVVADRMHKRRVIQAGQTLTAGVAVAIGLLLYFERLEFWHLVVSAAVQGATFALIGPAWQAILPEVVGMRRLMNATALNMGGNNVMRLIAPAGGGLLLAVMGPAYVYFLMAAFFVFCVLMLSKVPMDSESIGHPDRPADAPPPVTSRSRGGLRDIVDGLRYAANTPTILLLLVTNLVIMLVSMPYMTLLPGYVLDVLEGGPKMLGALQSVASIGALFGTFVIASIPSRRRGRLLIWGSVMMGIALLGFSLSTVVWVTAPIMVVIALGQTIRQSVGNVLVQAYVDDAYRGRILGIFATQQNVVMFGAFLVGVLASWVGPQLALGGMATVLVAVSLGLLLFVPRLRELD